MSEDQVTDEQLLQMIGTYEVKLRLANARADALQAKLTNLENQIAEHKDVVKPQVLKGGKK